jgi:anti-anti-sigma factor
MDKGNVFYAEQDGTCVFRLQGAINYRVANALDRFLDDTFATSRFRQVLVDLGELESIDSTGLGLLAKIANIARRRDGSRPLLFSSQPDINTLLSSICLDAAFILCERIPDLEAGTALPIGEPSDRELAETVLAAHRRLCEMNEGNRAMFQNVVDAFELDLGKTP